MSEQSITAGDLLPRLEQLLTELREATRDAGHLSDDRANLEGRLAALHTYTLDAVALLGSVARASLIALEAAELPDTTRARITEVLRPAQHNASDSA